MTAEEVAPLIRGPVGSKVQLEILRPGGSRTQMVTLTRIKIEQAGPAPESKSVTGLGIRDSVKAGVQQLAKHLEKQVTLNSFISTKLKAFIITRLNARIWRGR
jgi:C-terminal processing protease CtpA/Prc